ncbi:unnamed protein product [Auanema sp. JU1783]|nr:unnamed protein product [Auanema sp. JU1783]
MSDSVARDEQPRKPVFRASVLGQKADEVWSQTKKNFDSSSSSKHLVLEKKNLSDVLAKMAAEKREKEEKSKEQPSFVFGSNIASRVIIDNEVTEETDDNAPVKAEELFKNVASNPEEKTESNPDKFRAEAEAAAATEKQKIEERQQASTSVTVITGEEDDEVMHQTACKLHIFDKEKSKWVEKGLSHIKLNRRRINGDSHFRIVARTAGNHRVVINSKIINDMILERVDQKRIKISAMGPDSTQMQIFLITIGFSKTDINVEQFYESLRNAYEAEKSSGRKRKAVDDDEEEGLASKKGAVSHETSLENVPNEDEDSRKEDESEVEDNDESNDD